MRKYVLCPGYITSKKDGDIHYVPASKIAFLYGVKPSECYIDDPDVQWNWQTGLTQEHLDSLIWLFPDSTGNYKLPS